MTKDLGMGRKGGILGAKYWSDLYAPLPMLDTGYRIKIVEKFTYTLVKSPDVSIRGFLIDRNGIARCGFMFIKKNNYKDLT